MRRLKPAGIFLTMNVGFAAGWTHIPPASASVPQDFPSPPTAEPIVADYDRTLGSEEKYHKFETRVTKAVVHAAEAGRQPFVERHDSDSFSVRLSCIKGIAWIKLCSSEFTRSEP